MDNLKNFLFELDYIITIYDDIKNIFLDIRKTDISIFNVYNKNDIFLFIKICNTCFYSNFHKESKFLTNDDVITIIKYYDNFKPDENKFTEYINNYLDDIFFNRRIWQCFDYGENLNSLKNEFNNFNDIYNTYKKSKNDIV